MNILLTGASGFVGRNLMHALQLAGHVVKPVSRRHGIDAQTLLHARDWHPLLNGVDIVINAMGIIAEARGQGFAALHSMAPSALFEACETQGVQRVIQISAVGCTEQAVSAYHRSKWVADQHLRSSTLRWFVLQPSLLYGAGGTSAQWFMRMAQSPVLLQIGDGQQVVQPIHIRDLVATVLQCLSNERTNQNLDLVSERVWTLPDWIADMRAALNKPAAMRIGIPLGLAQLAFSLGQHASPLLHPDNLQMLLTSKPHNPQAWINFMGHPPTPHHHALFFSDARQPSGNPS